MRQAAVDLLGAHISTSQHLALLYCDTLINASRDASTAVRKSATRILCEACIRQPGFPRATDAAVAILHRIDDSQETISELVVKLFHSLWFPVAPAGP